MFKATHTIKENNGDHNFEVGTKVFFATKPKTRHMYKDEAIKNGKWHCGTEDRKYYVMEDEAGMQQSVLSTELKEIV